MGLCISIECADISLNRSFIFVRLVVTLAFLATTSIRLYLLLLLWWPLLLAS